MTEDQHDELRKVLEDHGFSRIDFSKNNIKCCCIIEDQEISLHCVLSNCFPYELPTIYISEDSYAKIAPIPHINHDLSVCTFDKTVCFPNFLYPVSVVEQSFLQAQTTIRDGILRVNFSDFFEEINAYWQLDSKKFAECIVSGTSQEKIVSLYWGESRLYIADTKKQLDSFLVNIGETKRYQKNYYDCLYLPLSIKLYPPFPKTNIELYDLLKTDPTVFGSYNKYIQSHLSSGAFILTSTPNTGARSFQLWFHSPVFPRINGFRKGHVPVYLAFLHDKQQRTLYKYSVTNLEQNRLFFRGGEGVQTTVSKCAIIGCGSVGGYIAEALAEYGVQRFVLNDNDIISEDNIARHFCGYEYIGKKKTCSVSDKLKKHNPNVKTEIYDENGIVFIDDHHDVLNSCDFIVVATAYTPLEYKIMTQYNAQNIIKPVVLVWVEPYLTAGHAIIVQNPQDIFSEFFTTEFAFNHSVLANASDFSKKEAGCQSTFIPYSAFHLKRFLYTFLDFMMQDVFAKDKPGNYLFTWCGDLFAVKSLGGKIASEWSDSENFSTHITRID